MLHGLRDNLHRAFTTRNKLKEYRFTILRPGGNDTGLVFGINRDAQQRKNIADILLERYQNVEQVGFINDDIQNAELMMTGGEFCGNATSSAAFHILRGRPGRILIKVSGVQNKLQAGVTPDGEGFSQMPVYDDPACVKDDPEAPTNAFVSLEGITHYIDFDITKIKSLTVDEIKEKARRQMALKQIDHNAACGIIYAEKRKDGWTIHPIIYVRDADTLYYETACGSGTAALGLTLAKKKGGTIKEVSVLQPSGLSIKVSAEFDGSSFGYTQIQSPVEKLQEGTLKMKPTQPGSRMHPHYHFSPSRKVWKSLIRN